jgi:hypothetical protein
MSDNALALSIHLNIMLFIFYTKVDINIKGDNF